MTKRAKILFITAGVIASVGTVFNTFILPRLFPTVACVVQNDQGEIAKVYGDDCRGNVKAIAVLEAK